MWETVRDRDSDSLRDRGGQGCLREGEKDTQGLGEWGQRGEMSDSFGARVPYGLKSLMSPYLTLSLGRHWWGREG